MEIKSKYNNFIILFFTILSCLSAGYGGLALHSGSDISMHEKIIIGLCCIAFFILCSFFFKRPTIVIYSVENSELIIHYTVAFFFKKRKIISKSKFQFYLNKREETNRTVLIGENSLTILDMKSNFIFGISTTRHFFNKKDIESFAVFLRSQGVKEKIYYYKER